MGGLGLTEYGTYAASPRFLGSEILKEALPWHTIRTISHHPHHRHSQSVAAARNGSSSADLSWRSSLSRSSCLAVTMTTWSRSQPLNPASPQRHRQPRRHRNLRLTTQLLRAVRRSTLNNASLTTHSAGHPLGVPCDHLGITPSQPSPCDARPVPHINYVGPIRPICGRLPCSD